MSNKIIVAHIGVDLDAVMSSWLVKRFIPKWGDAQIMFVPAGTTLEGMEPDADPNIIHVDTGLGKFDHHQIPDPKKEYCAAKRVYDFLFEQGYIKGLEQEALERMALFATKIDHFGELYFPDPRADTYDFCLHQIADGFKTSSSSDENTCTVLWQCLDATLQVMKQKIASEKDIENGFVFKTKWGKGIAGETKNEEFMKSALMMGYKIVIRRHPTHGNIRIKSEPSPAIDLTGVHEQILRKDAHGTWFLHISKNMLLNGSSKRPGSVPTSLSIAQVIEIIKEIS